MINNINQKVDRVYVVSVKSYSERINHIKNEMNRHRIDFHFVFNNDADELSEDITCKFDKNLSLPQISLIMKNIEVWNDAIMNNFQNILVFEDDAILTKNFVTDLVSIINDVKKIKPGYLVFLGGADTKVPFNKIKTNKNIFKHPIATAEGYLTDLMACKKRVHYIESMKNKIRLPNDHLIKHLDKKLNIINFWSRKPLVEQGSVTGIFKTSLDRNRGKHSLLYNKIRYKWMKLKRRKLPDFFVKIFLKLKLLNANKD